MADWKNGHKQWCGKTGENGHDWEIRETSKSGYGIFLKRKFLRQETILIERPALCVEEYNEVSKNSVLYNSNYRDNPASVNRAVENLSSKGDRTLNEIFKTNCIATGEEGENGKLTNRAVCCLNFSRINHSCLGNTHHNFIPDLGKDGLIFVFANRDLEAGTELNFSYVSNRLLSKEKRQEHLKRVWFFDCKCEACSKDDKYLTATLNRIAELDKGLGDYGSNGHVDLALQCGDELKKLFDHRTISYGAANYSKLYYDMFQVCIMRKTYHKRAAEYLKMSYEEDLKFYKVECKELKLKRRHMTNPKIHYNYCLLDNFEEVKAAGGDINEGFKAYEAERKRVLDEDVALRRMEEADEKARVEEKGLVDAVAKDDDEMIDLRKKRAVEKEEKEVVLRGVEERERRAQVGDALDKLEGKEKAIL